jgi:hypothetical protein
MLKIEKIKIAVTIHTATHRIDGTYFMVPDSRFIDDLNARQREFIPLRDAVVTSSRDGVDTEYRCDFIAVSVRNIVLFSPNPKTVDGARRVLRIEPPIEALAGLARPRG